ncbi:hypothetical protein [Nocardia testacea]|uniref:hypothetical protein n=1 Tax=Nocardia testacea TaxID=248551 RepID=UPI003A863DF2
MILRTVADLPCHVDYPLIMDDGSINSRFRASDDLRKLIIQLRLHEVRAIGATEWLHEELDGIAKLRKGAEWQDLSTVKRLNCTRQGVRAIATPYRLQMQTPLQVAHSGLLAARDKFSTGSVTTSRILLGELTVPGPFGFGLRFADSQLGRVVLSRLGSTSLVAEWNPNKLGCVCQ